MDKNKQIEAGDLYRAYRKKEEKEEKEKTGKRPWWKPEIAGGRIDISHGAKRVKHWVLKLTWRF